MLINFAAYLLLLTITSSSGKAMEIGPSELGSETENSTILLYNACLEYMLALEQSLGCDCCKFFQNLFNTPNALDVQKRMVDMRRLLDLLLSPDGDLSDFQKYFEEMNPPGKPVGSVFFSYCSILLKNHQQYRNILEKNDDIYCCVICMDDEREILYVPCNHLACCVGCRNELRMGTRNCPVCKQEANAERIYPKTCMNCFEIPADIISLSCKHVAECQKCQKEESGICRYCKIATKFTKIFRS